jgi:hypothetical protein
MTNTLFVASRSADAKQGCWRPIGRLDRLDKGYRFVYTRGAKEYQGFDPLPGMPELTEVYESDELFPVFANRLLGRSRREYEAYLAWGGFDVAAPPDPIAVLGVTEGRRVTDQIEVFPLPQPDAQGCFVNKFFLHGVRWMPDAAIEEINRLNPNERLAPLPDIGNQADPNAVAIRTRTPRKRFLIGYVPGYLATDVRQVCDRCDHDAIEITVERVNPDAPFQHRLLCRMRARWPDGFEPCSGHAFESLAAHSAAPESL